MIHYTCDLCKRDLDPDEDIRYVVKIEISAAFDPAVDIQEDDDRDHLQEIQELLDQLEQSQGDRIGEDVTRAALRSLPGVPPQVFQNPLGRENAKLLDFSKN